MPTMGPTRPGSSVASPHIRCSVSVFIAQTTVKETPCRRRTRRHVVVDTTLGSLTIVASGDAITGLYFRHHIRRPAQERFGPEVALGDDALLADGAAQLPRVPFWRPPRVRPCVRRMWRRLPALGVGHGLAGPVRPDDHLRGHRPAIGRQGAVVSRRSGRGRQPAVHLRPVPTACSALTASSPATPAVSSASGHCSTSRSPPRSQRGRLFQPWTRDRTGGTPPRRGDERRRRPRHLVASHARGRPPGIRRGWAGDQETSSSCTTSRLTN